MDLDDIDEGTSLQINLPEIDGSKRNLKTLDDAFQNLQYEDHKTRETTNFKLNTCAVHSSGALLLLESDRLLLGATNSRNFVEDKKIDPSKQGPIRVENGDDSSSDDEKMEIRMNKTPPKIDSKNNTPSKNASKLDVKNDSKVTPTKVPPNEKSPKKENSKIKTPEKILKERESMYEISIWDPLDPHQEDEKSVKKPFLKSM